MSLTEKLLVLFWDGNTKALESVWNVALHRTRATAWTMNETPYEVRPSPGRGYGVFATQDIPSKIILPEPKNPMMRLPFLRGVQRTVTLSHCCNDLALDRPLLLQDPEKAFTLYENLEYADQVSNVAKNAKGAGLITRRLIKSGEELSRYYGIQHWLLFEFWEKKPVAGCLGDYNPERVPEFLKQVIFGLPTAYEELKLRKQEEQKEEKMHFPAAVLNSGEARRVNAILNRLPSLFLLHSLGNTLELVPALKKLVQEQINKIKLLTP